MDTDDQTRTNGSRETEDFCLRATLEFTALENVMLWFQECGLAFVGLVHDCPAAPFDFVSDFESFLVERIETEVANGLDDVWPNGVRLLLVPPAELDA
jgi:hypothetical protein